MTYSISTNNHNSKNMGLSPAMNCTQALDICKSNKAISNLNDTAIEIINKNTNNKTKTIMSGKFTFLGIMLAMMSFSMNTKAADELFLSQDSANNYEKICSADGKTLNVKLKRSLSAGFKSTLVLPFDLNEEQVENVFGKDVEILEIVGYNGNGAEPTFKSIKYIEANVPFLITVSKAFSTILFANVVVKAPDSKTPTVKVGDDKLYAKFICNYGYTLNLGTEAFYFSQNEFRRSEGGSTAKSTKGYFTLSDMPGTSTYEKVFVPSTATRVETINSFKDENTAYNLFGMRVKNTEKGFILRNGKKYIVK